MSVGVHRQRGKSDMGRAAISLWKQDVAAGLALALYVLILYLLAGAWVDFAPIANAIWQPERVPIFGLPTGCRENSPCITSEHPARAQFIRRRNFEDAPSHCIKHVDDVAPSYMGRLACLYDNDLIGNTESVRSRF